MIDTNTLPQREDRVRSLFSARILFNNRNSTIDCTVRNLSAGGAKLEVSNPASIPESFELEIAAKSRTHRATIRWRNGNHVGVQFLSSVRQGGDGDEASRHERENRRLKAIVATLTKRLEDLGQSVASDGGVSASGI